MSGETQKPQRPPLSQERREDLELALTRMQSLSEMFYREAQYLGDHRFLEHAGLMNEMVKVYRLALRDGGIDFQMNAVSLREAEAHYLGEKVGCMWGPALGNPETLRVFIEGMLDVPVRAGVTEEGWKALVFLDVVQVTVPTNGGPPIPNGEDEEVDEPTEPLELPEKPRKEPEETPAAAMVGVDASVLDAGSWGTLEDPEEVARKTA
jgi:hypothetical protein